MFTGIIQKQGHIKNIEKGQESFQLKVHCKNYLQDVSIGDSIATNGVCLTVVWKDTNHFIADVMPTTFRKTTFSRLKPGDTVNLEKAMGIKDRFDGHIVSGHIDSIGKIKNIKRESNAVVLTIEPDYDKLKFMVPEGSVAVDGISLTIANLEKKTFDISIIPHTLKETSLQKKKVGDFVNIECDVLGKYVARLLGFKNQTKNKEEKITYDFLQENGFM